MNKKTCIAGATLLALGVGELAFMQSANAFNFMNPSEWFGGSNRNRYYDDDYYYDRGRYGYRRGRGYGRGWGYGPGWGGYGPYGYGGWPGYGYPGAGQAKSEPAPVPIPQ